MSSRGKSWTLGGARAATSLAVLDLESAAPAAGVLTIRRSVGVFTAIVLATTVLATAGLATTVLATPAGAAEADGVVGIYAYSRQGAVRQGSGFFLTTQGDLVTCYHVVHDAQRIEIYDRWRHEYHDVLVVDLMPEYDLARLRVRNPRQLPIVGLEVHPEGERIEGREGVEVIGHPQGTVFQRLRGHFTSDSVFQDAKTLWYGGQPVFREGSRLEVIPLDLTTFSGMSGAPLFYRGRVLGVVAGSWIEGGTLAWAVPLRYALREPRDPRLPAAPADLGYWPEPALERAHQRGLAASVVVDHDAARALKSFRAAVGEMDAAYAELERHAEDALPRARRAFKELSAAIFERDQLGIEAFSEVKAPVLDLHESLRPFGKVFGAYDRALQQLGEAKDALRPKVRARLPALRDAESRRVVESALRQIAHTEESASQVTWQVFADLQRGLTEMGEAIRHEEHLAEILAAGRGRDPREVLRAVDLEIREILELHREAVFTLRGALDAASSERLRLDSTAQVTSLREICKVAEIVVYQRLE